MQIKKRRSTALIPAIWVLVAASTAPLAAAAPAWRRTRVSEQRHNRRATPLDAAQTVFGGTTIPVQCTQGCAAFSGDLPACQTDQCACTLVPAAQVCAECVADWPAMERYNGLLDVCVAAGFVKEGATTYVQSATGTRQSNGTSTSTFTGSASGSSTGTGTLTQTITQTVTVSGGAVAQGSGQPAKTITTTVVVAGPNSTLSPSQSPSPILSPSNSTSDDTIVTVTLSPAPAAPGLTPAAAVPSSNIINNATVASGNVTNPLQSNTTTNATLTGAQSNNTSNASLTGTPTLGTNAAASGNSTAGALSAVQAFFKFDLQLECKDDCEDWSRLQETCQDDKCVCSAAGLQGASKCTACLSKGVQGDDYPQQMIAYGAFRKNCTAEYPDVVEEASCAAAASASASPTGLLAASDINNTALTNASANATLAHADSNGTDKNISRKAVNSTDPDAAFLRAAPWPLWIWQYGPVFGAFAQMLLIGAVTWVHMLLMG